MRGVGGLEGGDDVEEGGGKVWRGGQVLLLQQRDGGQRVQHLLSYTSVAWGDEESALRRLMDWTDGALHSDSLGPVTYFLQQVLLRDDHRPLQRQPLPPPLPQHGLLPLLRRLRTGEGSGRGRRREGQADPEHGLDIVAVVLGGGGIRVAAAGGAEGGGGGGGGGEQRDPFEEAGLDLLEDDAVGGRACVCCAVWEGRDVSHDKSIETTGGLSSRSLSTQVKDGTRTDLLVGGARKLGEAGRERLTPPQQEGEDLGNLSCVV